MRCPWDSSTVESAPSSHLHLVVEGQEGQVVRGPARRGRGGPPGRAGTRTGRSRRTPPRTARCSRPACSRSIRRAVEDDLTALRRVEPEDQLGEGRLAAAVAADQEHQLAPADGEVDRSEAKVRSSVSVVVRVVDAAQLQPLPHPVGERRSSEPPAGAGRRCAQAHPQALDLVQGDAGPAEGRQHLEEDVEGRPGRG